jgi:hypothetical protein
MNTIKEKTFKIKGNTLKIIYYKSIKIVIDYQILKYRFYLGNDLNFDNQQFFLHFNKNYAIKIYNAITNILKQKNK